MNPHFEDKVKTDILKIKEHRTENKLESLTKRKWNADEYDGWEMNAINAKKVYKLH